jgi:hypothetical protein
MKWILRVHRRDASRKTPLVMVDAGKYIMYRFSSSTNYAKKKTIY